MNGKYLIQNCSLLLSVNALSLSTAIARLEWGVMALSSNPAKSRKLGIGARDNAVSFGGVHFITGSYIYCDEDGILVGAEKLHS